MGAQHPHLSALRKEQGEEFVTALGGATKDEKA